MVFIHNNYTAEGIAQVVANGGVEDSFFVKKQALRALLIVARATTLSPQSG